MPPKVTALDHLVLTVTDISATLDFYMEILGMEAKVFHPADGSTRHALRFGSQKINLHAKGREFDPKAANAAHGTADLCFLTETPLSDWQAHLTAKGIEIQEGPVQRTGAIGPIMSLYVRDPDGNLIEIAVPSS